MSNTRRQPANIIEPELYRDDDAVRERESVPFAGLGSHSFPKHPYAVEKPTKTRMKVVQAFLDKVERIPTANERAAAKAGRE